MAHSIIMNIRSIVDPSWLFNTHYALVGLYLLSKKLISISDQKAMQARAYKYPPSQVVTVLVGA